MYRSVVLYVYDEATISEQEKWSLDGLGEYWKIPPSKNLSERVHVIRPASFAES